MQLPKNDQIIAKVSLLRLPQDKFHIGKHANILSSVIFLVLGCLLEAHYFEIIDILQECRFSSVHIGGLASNHVDIYLYTNIRVLYWIGVSNPGAWELVLCDHIGIGLI